MQSFFNDNFPTEAKVLMYFCIIAHVFLPLKVDFNWSTMCFMKDCGQTQFFLSTDPCYFMYNPHCFFTIMLHRSHTSFSSTILVQFCWCALLQVCALLGLMHLYLHLPISRNATTVENRPYACLAQSHLSTVKILSLRTHCHTPCKIKNNQFLN